MKIITFSACEAEVRGYLHEINRRMPDHTVRPALVVVPGGGYNHLSPREADPPALEFFSEGCNVFILSYSVGQQAGNCRPLRQLAEVIRTLRQNGDIWAIDPARIAVLGFSAGGHLAASLGAHWEDFSRECRPDALILSYPVITMGQFTHPGTKALVTGGDEKLEDYFSLENHIGENFPPSFVWHTVDDGSVPLENSLLLVSALRRAGIPFEYHVFAHGAHGLSVCTREVGTESPAVRPWVSLSMTWLNNRFQFTP